MPPKSKVLKANTQKHKTQKNPPQNKKIKNQECPPGYHYVTGHIRKCHSGSKIWVQEHFAKNPGYEPPLDQQALEKIFKEADTKKFLKLGKICKFPENEYLDPIIQFWLDYWKNKKLPFPPDLTPRLIKSMIAKESSFNPEIQAKDSLAKGLLQLTDETRRLLGGKINNGYQEIKNHQIIISPEDLFIPNVNVACGIRWISYKFKLIPKKEEKNTFNTFRNYNNWNHGGEKYATDIFKMAEKKCP